MDTEQSSFGSKVPPLLCTKIGSPIPLPTGHTESGISSTFRIAVSLEMVIDIQTDSHLFSISFLYSLPLIRLSSLKGAVKTKRMSMKNDNVVVRMRAELVRAHNV